MKQLMKDAYGVGLAGNQVGTLRRVFVFQEDEDEVRALVNPRIVERSDEIGRRGGGLPLDPAGARAGRAVGQP